MLTACQSSQLASILLLRLLPLWELTDIICFWWCVLLRTLVSWLKIYALAYDSRLGNTKLNNHSLLFECCFAKTGLNTHQQIYLSLRHLSLQGVGAFWLIGIFITNVVIGLTTWRNVEEEHDGLEPLSGLQICIIFMLQGVITMLYLYPHVGLMLEIKKGIMTPETYPREEFSCCCV